MISMLIFLPFPLLQLGHVQLLFDIDHIQIHFVLEASFFASQEIAELPGNLLLNCLALLDRERQRPSSRHTQAIVFGGLVRIVVVCLGPLLQFGIQSPLDNVLVHFHRVLRLIPDDGGSKIVQRLWHLVRLQVEAGVHEGDLLRLLPQHCPIAPEHATEVILLVLHPPCLSVRLRGVAVGQHHGRVGARVLLGGVAVLVSDFPPIARAPLQQRDGVR
mmetsp:Transcript_9891/g.18709  ORF Transcript_9891/g.18709 Transcript_9891/m.18709 type:complete len:217 (+) Transcript_9891:756-1406(+)